MKIINTSKSLPSIKQSDILSKMAVYPRLHFCSLDLSNYIGILKHGSFGISLKNFPIYIACNTDTNTDIIRINGDNKGYELDNNVDFEKLRNKINSTKNFHIEVDIPANIREHTGIGISTQIIGGIYLLCAKHCGIDLNINDLFDIGVGHVSTLGLNLLFNSGLIIENGVSYKNSIEKPVNSIVKIDDFPFQIIIAIPKRNRSLFAKFEDDFWNSILPENTNITKSVYREFYGECLPAIAEKDFSSFAGSIDKIVHLGSKAKEEEIQKQETKVLLEQLRIKFGCAGVSSLGPTVYSFYDKDPTEILRDTKNEYYDFYVIKNDE
jgi:beta-RFAP synthase